jgi:hypothetical protein
MTVAPGGESQPHRVNEIGAFFEGLNSKPTGM